MSIKSCVSHCSSLEWSCPLLFRSSFSKMSRQGKIAPTTSNPPKLQVKASPFLCLSRIKRKPNDSAELCLYCQVFPILQVSPCTLIVFSTCMLVCIAVPCWCLLNGPWHCTYTQGYYQGLHRCSFQSLFPSGTSKEMAEETRAFRWHGTITLLCITLHYNSQSHQVPSHVMATIQSNKLLPELRLFPWFLFHPSKYHCQAKH